MNIAILLAGGVGKRMGSKTPKQFLTMDDKPVLAFPLEAFQNHPMIDAIEVVCLEGYDNQVREIADKYGITKLKWITRGGETCQDSIRNGLYNLEGKVADDDIACIHLSSYPLIDEECITSAIETASKYGSAVSAEPVVTLTFCTDDGESATEFYPREKLRLITSPLTYHYGEILALYKRAYAENRGVEGTAYADTLWVEYGNRHYFNTAPKHNVKITKPQDIDFFKAILAIIEKENS